MTPDPNLPPSNSLSRIDEARRHFLGVAAAVTARAAAVGVLAVTVLPSLANAQNNQGNNNSRGNNKNRGNNNNHGGGNGPLCFLRGTSILTPSGAVRIEDLRRGDLVETLDGEAMSVLWMGRQIYRKRSRSWPETVMPIRVARGALAEQTPHSDLYLSPGHALFIDGVFIRIKDLVNGTSIAPVFPNDREVIEYFNPLLATHQAILAEGAPAETFLFRDRDYENFTNFVEFESLYPNGLRSMKPYAPIANEGGGRAHLKALLGLAAFPPAPVRNPIADAYRRLTLRAEELAS